MFLAAWRFFAIVVGATTFVAVPLPAQNRPLLAQNGEQKPAEAGKGEIAKEVAGRPDEVAEASRVMTGPAARGECVWLGERAVGLMWKDDLDTAFRPAGSIRPFHLLRHRRRRRQRKSQEPNSRLRN